MAKPLSLLLSVRSLSLPSEFSLPREHRRHFRRGVDALASALAFAVDEQRTREANARLLQALEVVGKVAREIATATEPTRRRADAGTHAACIKLEADVRRLIQREEGKPKPKSDEKPDGWVYEWRELRNLSLRETFADLKGSLVRAGFMDAKTEQPTQLAIARGVARIPCKWARIQWNVPRWRSAARTLRKAEKRHNRMLAGVAR